MTRPGFVLEVDERTPPLLVHSGESLKLEKFPLGTRVIYPPETLPGLEDPAAAIEAALDAPIDSPPLRELLLPGDEAHHRLRRHQPPAASDAPARHPPADHRGRPDPGRRGRRRRRRADRRQCPASADDGCGDSTGGRRARLPLVLAGPAHQPRRRGPRRPAARRADRRGRRRRDQQAGRRKRPADLREREPGRDGRRPQVGGDRARVVQVAAPPPQQPHDGPLAVLHGSREVGAALLRLADGPAAQPVDEDLPDRDDAQQPGLPELDGLPDQARVGVVGPRSGHGVRSRPRSGSDAGAATPPHLPAHGGRLRAHQRPGR